MNAICSLLHHRHFPDVIFIAHMAAKSLFHGGWQSDGNFFSKSPQATCDPDDNYYEGSLGHTRRLPGPEAAVPNQRGFRHGFNRKHQRYVAVRSEKPEQIY
jgi:hypothetical protein